MPQRLLLEGSDIDDLLLRVQAEHGPQAKIVHAEQRLVGGIAGFFARRRYQLAVQVEDQDVVPAPTVSRPGGPVSFDDLLTRADGGDGGPHADRVEPAEITQLPTQRGRRLSTQTPQFESLLGSLLDRAERTDDEPPVRPVASVATTVSASPSQVAPSTSRTSIAPATQARPTPLQPRGRADDGEPDIAAALAATTGATRTTAWDRVLMGRADRWATARPRPAPVAPSRRVDCPTSDSTASTAALIALGLPADRLPEHAATDSRSALLDLLAGLPTPASRRLWGTTVVVGPQDLARRAVDGIVEHAGGSGDDVILTTSGAPSAADLAVRASALTTANGAAVVLIETPSTREAARRAGRLTAGLGLGTVVAALDATRDGAATREWLAELAGSGRSVDQLAAFDVAESPTPLGLLGLGVDVAWLDGRPAGVGSWAAPCLDRLLAGDAHAG